MRLSCSAFRHYKLFDTDRACAISRLRESSRYQTVSLTSWLDTHFNSYSPIIPLDMSSTEYISPRSSVNAPTSPTQHPRPFTHLHNNQVQQQRPKLHSIASTALNAIPHSEHHQWYSQPSPHCFWCTTHQAQPYLVAEQRGTQRPWRFVAHQKM